MPFFGWLLERMFDTHCGRMCSLQILLYCSCDYARICQLLIACVIALQVYINVYIYVYIYIYEAYFLLKMRAPGYLGATLDNAAFDLLRFCDIDVFIETSLFESCPCHLSAHVFV